MNKKLYVGNLPFAAEEAQLKALFSEDGMQVLTIRILMDRETGRSRGFGFVEMSTPEDAQKAIGALNGREFMGRALLVSEARESVSNASGTSGFSDRSGGRHFRGGRGDFRD